MRNLFALKAIGYGHSMKMWVVVHFNVALVVISLSSQQLNHISSRLYGTPILVKPSRTEFYSVKVTGFAILNYLPQGARLIGIPASVAKYLPNDLGRVIG